MGPANITLRLNHAHWLHLLQFEASKHWAAEFGASAPFERKKRGAWWRLVPHIHHTSTNKVKETTELSQQCSGLDTNHFCGASKP
jgi:hypothetical protein